MSNSRLLLQIASKITAKDIVDFLCVPIDQNEQDVDAVRVGPIEIIFYSSPWWDSKELGNRKPWNLALDIGCNSSWNLTRKFLVLEMCSYFFEKFGGDFFAAFDTGTPAFAIGEKGLLLPEGEREYYSKFPLPFANRTFCQLPTV